MWCRDCRVARCNVVVGNERLVGEVMMNERRTRECVYGITNNEGVFNNMGGI